MSYVRAHRNLILLAHKFQNIIMKHIGNKEFCRCMPNHSSTISMRPAIVLCASQTYGLNEKMLVTSLRTSSLHTRTISVAYSYVSSCLLLTMKSGSIDGGIYDTLGQQHIQQRTFVLCLLVKSAPISRTSSTEDLKHIV